MCVCVCVRMCELMLSEIQNTVLSTFIEATVNLPYLVGHFLDKTSMTQQFTIFQDNLSEKKRRRRINLSKKEQKKSTRKRKMDSQSVGRLQMISSHIK